MTSADRSPDGSPQHARASRSIPMPLFKAEAEPCPTMFVQADRAAFKQVVQFLTGSSETSKQATSSTRGSIPDPSSKLYDRRNSNPKNRLVLNTVAHRAAYSKNNGGFSLVSPEVTSPSTLDFPRLTLSPVTPLIEDLFNKPSPYSQEEKAIAEKKFYLHPSPRVTKAEPKLLPLFPSPRD